MNNWVIAILAIKVMGIGVHLGKDGEPMDTKYSFWSRFFWNAVSIYMLYKAGLFK